MSIRWIRQVKLEGKPTTLEVMLGNHRMSDKCYVRVGSQEEFWFKPESDTRDAILNYGIMLLRDKLKDRDLTTEDGSPYSWN